MAVNHDDKVPNRFWGNPTWRMEHALLTMLREDTTAADVDSICLLFYAQKHLLPCEECCGHFGAMLEKNPPPTHSSASVLRDWLVDVHNIVNQRLGRLTITREKSANMHVLQASDLVRLVVHVLVLFAATISQRHTDKFADFVKALIKGLEHTTVSESREVLGLVDALRPLTISSNSMSLDEIQLHLAHTVGKRTFGDVIVAYELHKLTCSKQIGASSTSSSSMSSSSTSSLPTQSDSNAEIPNSAIPDEVIISIVVALSVLLAICVGFFVTQSSPPMDSTSMSSPMGSISSSSTSLSLSPSASLSL